MRRSLVPVVCCIAIFAVAALTATAAEPPAHKGGAPHPAGGHAVLMAASDLKWMDSPDAPGVKVAALHGDPGKGAAEFFVKLPAGLSVPMHYHNADHYVAVLSGTMKLGPEGGAEKTLGPGSGFYFTGKKKHTTACVAGADCVLFIDSRGKWDVVPEEKK